MKNIILLIFSVMIFTFNLPLGTFFILAAVTFVSVVLHELFGLTDKDRYRKDQ
ncbi:hypothetical protein ACFPU1_03345 [Thalassorhabdus alkalitolerans]|uniref:Uncharacterized protein n=1 Tax=Thalassorhabdus alkalitolerans TaxID=2282697 RepID=A0ABW0YK03_9BACI|nr:hypothetical protein [Thalassobacillus sp. C254]